MSTAERLKTAVLLAAVGAVAYVAWRGYRSGASIVENVKQTIDQAAADVQSAWVNNVAAPFQRGQDYMNGIAPVVSSKAWLYSDYGYTGIDPFTGRLVTDGEWYGNQDARRYDIEQMANGTAPAATSIDGAAFGVFPNAPRRSLSTAQAAAARRAYAATDPRRLDR